MKTSSVLAHLLVLIVGLAVLSGAVTAQTKRKKKRAVRKPVAAKTTTQTPGDATVISLADQYQDSSSQIIQPTSTPSLASTDPQVSDETAQRLKELAARIKKLEAAPKNEKSTYEERQKILLTNLDILTKAEQRVESLRKQRFELVDKESSIRTRLDQIEIDARPESIEKSVALVGTLRPEEIREAKRKSLDAEKRNLTNLLNEVVTTRTSLDQSLTNAEALDEKLRARLEKDINDALDSDQP
jgi:hypothetical protein